VTSLNDGVFMGCKKLKSAILQENVTSLGWYVFDGCTELASVSLPETLTKIGYGSFYGCTNLLSIVIPSKVSSIDNYAFRKCDNLTAVTIKVPNPLPITEMTFSNHNNATLYVPEGSKTAYSSAEYWNEFKEIIEGVYPGDIDVILGDANGDGRVTVADYTAIAHYIMADAPANFNEKAADANGDGKVNVADYTAVAHLILYGSVVRPESAPLLQKLLYRMGPQFDNLK
jgi:hypothetical protein